MNDEKKDCVLNLSTKDINGIHTPTHILSITLSFLRFALTQFRITCLLKQQ